MNKFEKYKTFFNRKKGEKEKIEKDIVSNTNDLKRLNIELQRKERALELVKKAALNTQKELELRISNIVTTALNAVFEDPYAFEIDFVERRGKTECDLFFVKNGNRIHPLTSSGVGVADIAAFALKVCSLSMSGYQQILITDEPFKHLKSEEPNQKAINMMKTISKELGIQIITVSDERAVMSDIMSGADRVFKVTQKTIEGNSISQVQVIK